MDIMLKCYICETKVVNLDAHFIECHSLENDVEENEPSQEFSSTTSGRHFCYLKKCTGECKSNPNLDKIQTEPPSQKTSQVTTTNKKGKEKPRHARRSFTTEQIKVLKSSYGLNKYCTPEERIKLSQLSGISEQSIKDWFNNQRKTERGKGKPPVQNKFVQDSKNKGRTLIKKVTSYTTEQIKLLKSSYDLNKYCTPEDRIKLSQLSGHSEQSIQKWFKKQQHKAKLLKRDSIKGHGVKCNVCEMIFSTEGSLKLHVIAIHENRRDFKCDICGKSFSIAIRLNTHIKKVHEG